MSAASPRTRCVAHHSPDTKSPRVSDLVVSHGAGDEKRTRTLSLGSDGAWRPLLLWPAQMHSLCSGREGRIALLLTVVVLSYGHAMGTAPRNVGTSRNRGGRWLGLAQSVLLFCERRRECTHQTCLWCPMERVTRSELGPPAWDATTLMARAGECLALLAPRGNAQDHYRDLVAVTCPGGTPGRLLGSHLYRLARRRPQLLAMTADLPRDHTLTAPKAHTTGPVHVAAAASPSRSAAGTTFHPSPYQQIGPGFALAI